MKILVLLTVAAVTRAQTYVPQDTPEVAAAKAAHLAELAKAGLAAGVPYYPRGHLSIGVPVVTPEGFVADTPEVAAAKAAHLSAVAAAASTRADPMFTMTAAPVTNPANYYSYTYPVYRYAAPRSSYYYASYAAPAASPAYSAVSAATRAAASAAAPVVITPDGFVADTQEVREAKAAHYRAHLDRILGIS